MMSQGQDNNEVRMTGTISTIKPIQTKTGAAMAEIILKVRQDKFRITSLGNVADHLLSACGPGDRLSITGSLSVSSWRDENTNEWKNSFSVQAWGAEIHGNKVAYQREKTQAEKPAGRESRRDVAQRFTAQDSDYF